MSEKKREVIFKGQLPENNAIKFHRDGGQIVIIFPETEKANTLALSLASGKVLDINIQFE
jgi:hypothetical protein